MPTRTVEEPGQTLAAHVRELLGLSWNKAKAMCASGRVWVDGARVSDPAARIAAGAKVEVDPTAEKVRPGVLDRERVLHEDADVLVVRKPAGLLTVPYSDEKDTLADQAAAYVRRGKRRGRRDPMIGVVQRLDKDTSGVLVFARTMRAKRALQQQLRAHTVHRRYLAIVHGDAKSATHDTAIVQDRGDGLRGSWGTRPGQPGDAPGHAKQSVTHVRVLERLRGATLVECRLETGRQHQIRIHLSEAGTPLVGERVYIREFAGPKIEAPRPMLHAAELGFDHPATGEPVRFEEAPPEDFRQVLAKLR